MQFKIYILFLVLTIKTFLHHNFVINNSIIYLKIYLHNLFIKNQRFIIQKIFYLNNISLLSWIMEILLYI